MSEETKTPKGDEGGECNRTTCKCGPAMYFNESTRKFYCVSCALDMQEYENGRPEPFCIFKDFYRKRVVNYSGLYSRIAAPWVE